MNIREVYKYKPIKKHRASKIIVQIKEVRLIDKENQASLGFSPNN